MKGSHVYKSEIRRSAQVHRAGFALFGRLVGRYYGIYQDLEACTVKRRLNLDNEALSRYAEYYPKPAVSKTLLRWLAGGCFGLCVAVIYWWISWR